MTAERLLHVLTEEHRTLERVLSALELKGQDLGDRPFPLDFFEQALEFLTNFSDRCHLPKEEERLFPLLWEKGVPLEKGPLGALMDDHQAGRRQLAAIHAELPAAAEGNPEATATIRLGIATYVRLMRQHIQREEQRVFNVARNLLDSGDLERLERDFEDVEEQQIGPGFHERYESLATRLSNAAGKRS